LRQFLGRLQDVVINVQRETPTIIAAAASLSF
jgi:hypothetical protein